MGEDHTRLTADQTLWRQVVRIIRERVRSGAYPLDGTLPREVDLASELAVSRNTVREAYRRLSDEGVLERRKRAGTRVISTGEHAKLRIDLDPQSSLRSLSQRSDLKVVRRVSAPLTEDLCALLPDPDERDWHRVECVRVAEDSRQALSWTAIHLAPDLRDVSLLIGQSRGQQFRLIEQRRPERMLRARALLFPVKLTAAMARLLDVARGAMALRVVQVMTNEAGSCRELVVSLYPAERYSFEMIFPLSDG